MALPSPERRTGWLCEERCMWHDPGNLNFDKWAQPSRHWEHAETKRRLLNLLKASGLHDVFVPVKGRSATDEELLYFHALEYIEKVKRLSAANGGDAGDEASFGPRGHEIAILSAGTAMAAVDAVLEGRCDNAYALLRPPGHHAVANMGMGFCLYNNIVLAAHHAFRRHSGSVSRVAIVDYDVHHGNGTQEAFYSDDRVLFVSIHQDDNYPRPSGKVHETGAGKGLGFNLNIPLPPGSGSGAYRAAFERVIVPAVDVFKPDLILVSSGFDGSYIDPLAHMMLSSEDFRYFAKTILTLADRHCSGRAAFMHEGGYSDVYVPFCGLAVLEEMSGCKTAVSDPLLGEVTKFAYQELQPWQDAVVVKAEANVAALRQQLEAAH